MPFWDSSSRTGPGQSRDGSYRVSCSQCRQYISDSPVKLGSVTCAVCAAALEAKMLTPDAMDMYNRSKGGMRNVSMLVMENDPTVLGEKFSLRTMGGALVRALGFAKEKPDDLESVKVARGKARKRLFEDVDLDEGMGSMEQIDAVLVEAKEKGSL